MDQIALLIHIVLTKVSISVHIMENCILSGPVCARCSQYNFSSDPARHDSIYFRTYTKTTIVGMWAKQRLLVQH